MAAISLCFGSAAVLVIAKHIIEGRAVTERISQDATDGTDAGDIAEGPQTTVPGETTTTTTTLPIIDSKSENFLLAAADGGACATPGTPWANAGAKDRPSNSRSDTIMMIRLDAENKRIAALSFPRDLYVSIPGRGKQRINAAYRPNQPNRLIQTIKSTFRIKTDHYIQVDFCAFKEIVDAVGGVDIPFKTPIQDVEHTGLNVTQPGCHHFGGDEALAYARSRHLKARIGGKWVGDGTSDFGRIARQQDLIRRVLARALDKGLLRPSVLSKLLNTLSDGHLVVSAELSADTMISFASVLRGINPDDMGRYQIKTTGTIINGASVQLFNPKAKNMAKIIQVFRGQAMLGSVASEVQTNVSARILPDPDVKC